MDNWLGDYSHPTLDACLELGRTKKRMGGRTRAPITLRLRLPNAFILLPVVPDFDFERLDPNSPEQAEWSKRAKRVLRQRQRALREALPESASQARSQNIVARLIQHPRVQAARGVALFWPILERREIDLRSLDEWLRQRHVDVYYPFIEKSEDGGLTTGFRLLTAVEELVLGPRRFAEPPTSARLALRGDIDVVVVPALAATADGHRLGYGSGFYDATLPDLCPPAYSIVVVHDFQQMLELPLEPHDFSCDEVLTDR